MAKAADKETEELINELRFLLVSRSIEKTDKYDEDIKDIQEELDYFYYGVLPSKEFL